MNSIPFNIYVSTPLTRRTNIQRITKQKNVSSNLLFLLRRQFESTEKVSYNRRNRPVRVFLLQRDMLFRYQAPLLQSLYILIASVHCSVLRTYYVVASVFFCNDRKKRSFFPLLLFVALKKAIYGFYYYFSSLLRRALYDGVIYSTTQPWIFNILYTIKAIRGDQFCTVEVFFLLFFIFSSFFLCYNILREMMVIFWTAFF